MREGLKRKAESGKEKKAPRAAEKCNGERGGDGEDKIGNVKEKFIGKPRSTENKRMNRKWRNGNREGIK